MNTENTYYDSDEKTVHDGRDDERTQYDESTSYDGRDDDKTIYNNGEREKTAAETKTDGGVWQKVTIGGAAGLVLGATVSYMTTARGAQSQDIEKPADAPAPDNGNPLVDNEVSMPSASTVSDDMTFSQAFAAARGEVGAGGAFEWHGNIYSTYTAEEWDSMSAADKQEYNNHFAWNKGSAAPEPKNDMASGSDTHAAPDNNLHATIDEQPQGQTNAAAQTAAEEQPAAEEHDATVVTVEPELQVLGMEYAPEYDANLIGVSLEGEDVLLIDEGADGTIEWAMSDLNDNGELDEGEIVNISQAGITIDDIIPPVGDFGGSDLSGDIVDYDEGPDYVNDGFGGDV